MSLPNADPFSTATSCAPCDSGRYSASNDDTSSNCPYSETSCPTHIGGTAACFDKLPNGDGSDSNTGNAGTLRRAVSDWIAGGGSKSTVVATYGPIEDWDVSEVTNMEDVFYNFGSFNADLSKWNTVAVTNMKWSKCTLPLFVATPSAVVYFEYTTIRVSSDHNSHTFYSVLFLCV